MTGWIKLHRSLVYWEWYDDINATRLLIHLLVTVNYEDKRWRGIIINAGSRMTSFERLAVETGLTVKQIRTGLEKLELAGEIKRYRASSGQVVALVKWEQLQGESENEAISWAVKGQSDGQSKGIERATTKEGKNNSNKLELKKKELTSSVSTVVERVYKFSRKHFPPSFLPKNLKGARSWCEEIRKINQLDGHDFDSIERVIKWGTSHKFWKVNFQTIMKLRQNNSQGVKFMDDFLHRMKNDTYKILTYKQVINNKKYEGKPFDYFKAVDKDKAGKKLYAHVDTIEEYNLTEI